MSSLSSSLSSIENDFSNIELSTNFLDNLSIEIGSDVSFESSTTPSIWNRFLFFNGELLNRTVNSKLRVFGIGTNPYSFIEMFHTGWGSFINSGLGNLFLTVGDEKIIELSHEKAVINKPVQITTEYIVCDLDSEGSIYYNQTNHVHMGCNGTNWKEMY